MGWFFVNIMLPLIAPIIGMFVLQRLPLPISDNQKHLLVPLKDGQLCWGAVAFCALTMYEIAAPGQGVPLVDGDAVHWLNTGLIMSLSASALIAVGGAVFPTEIKSMGIHDWYQHYQALATSLGLTTLSALAYTVVHFGVFKP